VEIGSGAGTFKGCEPRVIATDVIDCPWINVRCTALRLPFKDGSIPGLAAINVLHHLPSIGPFLREAARVLPPGGRCVCVEPWITPVSRLFYRWVHQEDCHPVDDPLFGVHTTDDRPMHGNTFVPYQALKDRRRLMAEIPDLRLLTVEPFAGLGWCLSKGFREGALLPNGWLRALLRVEDRTNALWAGWAGLNAVLVFERKP
jgi:SAM-dependent methyltransferase